MTPYRLDHLMAISMEVYDVTIINRLKDVMYATFRGKRIKPDAHVSLQSTSWKMYTRTYTAVPNIDFKRNNVKTEYKKLIWYHDTIYQTI